MTNLKTYVRPMGAWWRRNPFYGWYMVRELSCVFVTAYALVLLWGLQRLVAGRAAYDAWLTALADPGWVAFHVVALILVGYHAWTWFKVMPKTLPFISIAGRRIGDRSIISAGVLAAVVSSAGLFLAVWLATRGAGS